MNHKLIFLLSKHFFNIFLYKEVTKVALLSLFCGFIEELTVFSTYHVIYF